MVRSRLPVPSLLRLFGALLMLFPELVMGIPERLYDVLLKYSWVQEAFMYAVETYNYYRRDSAQYFKVLNVLKMQEEVNNQDHYHFTVDLAKTTCKKGFRSKKYKGIQKCKLIPGNRQVVNCSFVVKPGLPPLEFELFLECNVQMIVP